MTLKPGHCRSYSNAASGVENRTEPTKGERVFRLDTVDPNIRPSRLSSHHGNQARRDWFRNGRWQAREDRHNGAPALHRTNDIYPLP